jgi:3D (Asp-Asp-Asp) domain-containing protein
MRKRNFFMSTIFVATAGVAYLAGYSNGADVTTAEYKPVTDRLLDSYTEINTLRKEMMFRDEKIENMQERLASLEAQLAVPVVNSTSDLNFSSNVRVAKFRISAYSPYDDRNYINSDGNPNNTATGTKPKPGTFAVDPRVIPYGSKVTIVYADGTVEEGYAEDTGGAIKNNRIDVFRYTFDTAMDFGMKDAIVMWEEKL